jgi:hypothetical protein
VEIKKMNVKSILSVLLLLVVVFGFSGIASAATQKVLVQEAYDETVLVSPAYDEQVLVSEAWNETVFHHWLVDGIYTILHPAVYETVHHEAVYETVIVEDVPAYDEQVLVKEAYDEQVLVTAAYDEVIPAVFEEQVVREVPQGYFYNFCKDDYKKAFDKAVKFAEQQMKTHDYTSYFIKYVKDWGTKGHFVVFFNGLVEVQPEQTIHHEAVYETVHHEAVFETVHHEAVTHEEQVLVSEAYDEQVLVSEAYYENVPYFNNGPYFGGYPDLSWADVEAWADWIYSNGPNVVGGSGSWTPYFVVIPHEAVFETVHHEAVFQTIHHEAIYKDVEVPEPVVPTVVPSEGIPMENTGAPLAPLAVALVAIVGGLLTSRRL